MNTGCNCVVEPVRVPTVSGSGLGVNPSIPVRAVEKISSSGREMKDTGYVDEHLWDEGEADAVLPTVSGTDNGSVLKVVNGEWTKAPVSEYGAKELFVFTISYDDDESAYVSDTTYADVEDIFDEGALNVKAICPESGNDLCAVTEYIDDETRAGFYIDAVTTDYALGTVTCKRYLFATDDTDGDSVTVVDTYAWSMTAVT